MSREKNLVKNSLVLAIGKFLPRLTTFITLPILTAFLTKAEYGTYDLIDTLVSMVIPIATLQIQSAAFRFLIDCRKDKERIAPIVSNIFIVTIPISVIASFVITLFFPDFTLVMKILLGVYFLLDTLHQTIAQVTRGLGHNKDYSLSAILLSFTRMIGVVLCVYVGKQGLTGVLISLVAAQCAGIANNLRSTRLFRYIKPDLVSKAQIKTLIGYSWGLVPNSLSNWVLKLSDRLVITSVLGIEANAVYAVANKIPHLLSVAQTVLIMAWQENASIAVNDEDSSAYYSSMLDRMFCLVFGCAALLIAACPLLFKILVKGSYDQAYYHMPVLILALFFSVMSAFIGGIFIAHKRTANIGITTTLAAVLNLLIDLGTVNYIGIWAGSVSTLAAYFSLYLYRVIKCQSFQPIHVKVGKQILLVLILAGMTALCELRAPVFYAANAVLGAGLCLFINRETLRSMVADILKRVKK